MVRGSIGESRDDGPEEEGITSGTGQLHGGKWGVPEDRRKRKEMEMSVWVFDKRPALLDLVRCLGVTEYCKSERRLVRRLR